MELKKNLEAGARPIRKPFSQLAAWRKHFGLTAAALAEKAGLTGSFVSLLESGRAGYTQNSLEALAGAMGIEPWQLLGQDPGAPPYEVDAGLWDTLAEAERRQVLKLAEHAHGALRQMVKLHVTDLLAKKEVRR